MSATTNGLMAVNFKIVGNSEITESEIGEDCFAKSGPLNSSQDDDEWLTDSQSE
jgi:hypothetical protein